MRRLLLATSALLLVAPDMAMAYQAYGPSQQTKPARPAKPGQRPSHPNRPSQGHQPGRPSIQPVRPPQAHRPGRPSIQPVRPPHGNRPGRPSIQPVRPPHARPPIYRPGHRPPSFRPIQRPSFHYPRGWRYRRWHAGLFLPRIFLARPYYFYDYYDLGIGPPPPGYIWVRYGPDLLLVNVHTGRIADVIYGAFY